MMVVMVLNEDWCHIRYIRVLFLSYGYILFLFLIVIVMIMVVMMMLMLFIVMGFPTIVPIVIIMILMTAADPTSIINVIIPYIPTRRRGPSDFLGRQQLPP